MSTPDVRYYAVTNHGRMKIAAKSDAQARKIVRASPYLSKNLQRIVRETREEVLLDD